MDHELYKILAALTEYVSHLRAAGINIPVKVTAQCKAAALRMESYDLARNQNAG